MDRSKIVEEIFNSVGLIVNNQDRYILKPSDALDVLDKRVKERDLNYELLTYLNTINNVDNNQNINWLSEKSILNIFGHGNIDFKDLERKTKLIINCVIYDKNYEILSIEDQHKLLILNSVSTFREIIDKQNMILNRLLDKNLL